MARTSRCHYCGRTVKACRESETRAQFRCRCGRQWTVSVYRGGYSPSGTSIATGAVLGGIAAGPSGALLGGVVGACFGKTSRCRRCGGTGRPMDSRGRKTRYQCKNCYRVWVE